MRNTTTIWHLVTHGNGGGGSQMRHYFFATKEEAEAAFRERENPMEEDEIYSKQFDPSRAGIVAALNWVISMTCYNE